MTPGELLSIADRIAGWRKVLGLSQVEVAARMGKHSSSLSRWESGEVDPSQQSLSELCSKGFGITLEEFFGAITPPVRVSATG